VLRTLWISFPTTIPRGSDEFNASFSHGGWIRAHILRTAMERNVPPSQSPSRADSHGMIDAGCNANRVAAIVTTSWVGDRTDILLELFCTNATHPRTHVMVTAVRLSTR
jgi:hypothetical protein